MLLRENDEYWAKNYFEQAKDAYIQIEAYGKIDRMVDSNKLLQPSIDLDGLKLPPEGHLEMDTTLETESMTYMAKYNDRLCHEFDRYLG